MESESSFDSSIVVKDVEHFFKCLLAMYISSVETFN